MSRRRRRRGAIRDALRNVAGAALPAFVPGGAAAAGGLMAARPGLPMPRPRTTPTTVPMPRRAPIPGVRAGLPGLVVAGAAAAGGAMRGAIALCRKHPQWCAAVGGTAGIAAMIERGQLPMPRRRRSRGITGKEMSSFRRVHNVLSRFCAPAMKVRRPARRRTCP